MTTKSINEVKTVNSSRIGEIINDSKKYAEVTQLLADAGWDKYGEAEECFLADPYYTSYGAQKFFVKDGEPHGVTIGINVREGYGLPNLLIITEGNLTKSHMEWSGEVVELDSMAEDFGAVLADKYKDEVGICINIQDKEEDQEYLMGFVNDMRVEFQSRDDDDRQKPYHETVRLYHLKDCEYNFSQTELT